MNKALILFSILYAFTGCKSQKPTHQETVIQYYYGFSASDYDLIKSTIADRITITAGDYVMPYTQESYYEIFKWDSIFQTTYKLVKTEVQDGKVLASVTMSSIRNRFLKNPAMTCTYRVSFDKGLISKVEELECTDVDWSIWQREVESLVAWIDTNHPVLNGFIYDMSMVGAINYLKAIELYESREKK